MNLKYIRKLLIAALTWAFLSSQSLAFCQTVQNPSMGLSGHQLNLLVLGDSILWGQGLINKHKTWYLVKTFLSQNTGRDVLEHIEAHSGALIESGSEDDAPSPVDGEIDVGEPTVSDQVNRALRHYVDGSKVDLVLVSGCVNEVGTKNLLNAAAGTEVITRVTEEKCGPPLERLLHKITSSFPNADVILTGYYPLFSEKTKNDFFMKALARRFLKGRADAHNLRSKEMLERLVANSRVWYQTSNRTIAGVAAKINAELQSDGPRQTVSFAEIDFLPEYSFGAPETRLWGFNESPVRRLAVISTFGKVRLETNDERRRERIGSCNQFFKEKANETAEQKRERESRRLLCHFAALGHPNRKGAALYADAITNRLKSMSMR